MGQYGRRKVKLKEVCNRITVGHVGPMADRYTEDGIPFLRSQNITPFRLNLADIKYIPADFHQKLQAHASNLTSHWVKRAKNNHTRRIINQDINTGSTLKCLDIT
ncbi:MAG: hypothetical protein WCP86_09375, partial [bacterium]